MTPSRILLIVACVCWGLAALPLPFLAPVQLGWLGMLLWGISQLVR